MSSHRYRIETGRYGSQYGNVLNRICEHCSTADRETLELLKECPFFDPIIEEEFHVLNSCPRYEDARIRLKEDTRQLMQSPDGISQILSQNVLTKDLARFTTRCHSIKFPEDVSKDPKPTASSLTSGPAKNLKKTLKVKQ